MRWWWWRIGHTWAYLLLSEITRYLPYWKSQVYRNCEIETLSTSPIAVANAKVKVWIEGRVTTQTTQWIVTRSHRNEPTISYTSGRSCHYIGSSRLVYRSLCAKSGHIVHCIHLLLDVRP
jgi:hypothetical protein